MKPIPGFENIYSATREGEIWAHPRKGRGGHKGKFIRPWKVGHGYYEVSLYIETQKPKKFLVHRLVALAYIPNLRGLPEINHKNGNVTDNRVKNLEWSTSKQNKVHAWKNGLYTHKGTNHYLAKLDNKKVKSIRKKYTGKRGEVASLAREFSVADATIWDVVHGITWK